MAFGSEQICSFPQGRKAVQALLWSIFAFIFCISATTGCYFMKIDGHLTAAPPYRNFDKNGSSSIGLFGYEELNSGSNGFFCLTYSSSQLDSFLDTPWKAARIFGILANVFNGALLLLLISASCVSYSQLTLKGFAGLAFASSIFECLVFSLFASKIADAPYNGSFHLGGGVTILAIILSVVTGLFVLNIPPPDQARTNYTVTSPSHGAATRVGSSPFGSSVDHSGKRNFPSPKRSAMPETAPGGSSSAFEPGTETVTETLMPDGSRMIVKTTVFPDGSKTVEETIVSQQ